MHPLLAHFLHPRWLMEQFIEHFKLDQIYNYCFLFILGLGIGLMINSPTAVVDNQSSVTYEIDHNRLSLPHSDLVVLVLSNAFHAPVRSSIRKSWVRLVSDQHKVRTLFVVGLSNLNDDDDDDDKSHHLRLLQALNDERNQFGDLLLLKNVSNHDKASTSKLLAAFHELIQIYNFNFVLKVEDETFVLLDQFYESIIRPELQRDDHPSALYQGYFVGAEPAVRKGKRLDPKWFLCDTFLPYASGGGYLISNHLVQHIDRNRNELTIYRSDDVSVGTWLSPLKIRRVHDNRFDTQWNSRGCQNHHLITHKCPPDEMMERYERYHTSHRQCKQEFQRRAAYNYDWNELPSQCCA